MKIIDFFKKKKQAVLPNALMPYDLVSATIYCMKVGQAGYAVPWALVADSDGRLWINGNYTIDAQSGGTGSNVNMKVTKTKDGIEVDISQIDPKYTWNIGGNGGTGRWAGVPVVELKR